MIFFFLFIIILLPTVYFVSFVFVLFCFWQDSLTKKHEKTFLQLNKPQKTQTYSYSTTIYNNFSMKRCKMQLKLVVRNSGSHNKVRTNELVRIVRSLRIWLQMLISWVDVVQFLWNLECVYEISSYEYWAIFIAKFCVVFEIWGWYLPPTPVTIQPVEIGVTRGLVGSDKPRMCLDGSNFSKFSPAAQFLVKIYTKSLF